MQPRWATLRSLYVWRCATTALDKLSSPTSPCVHNAHTNCTAAPVVYTMEHGNVCWVHL